MNPNCGCTVYLRITHLCFALLTDLSHLRCKYYLISVIINI